MAAILVLSCLLAQPGFGAVFGTVTDAADSQAIADAEVSMWQAGSCVTLWTDSLGRYRIPLPAGRYTAIAYASGNRHDSHTVVILPGQDVCLDLRVTAQEPIPSVPTQSQDGVPRPPTETPIRSEILLWKGWDLVLPSSGNTNLLRIRQTGDSIVIQSGTELRGQVEKEGPIPVGEFRKFWDSLNVLGIWRLRDKYDPSRKPTASDTWGAIAISADDQQRGRMSKQVSFVAAQWAPQELWDVYYLLNSMERFARTVPDSVKDTLVPPGNR